MESDRLERVDVLGVGISAVDSETATAEIVRWIVDKESHYVTATNVHGVMEAQRDAQFRRILNGSGLTVPDGMPLVWLSHQAGHAQVRRVSGYDLVLSVSRALSERNLSAFYYGGAPVAADLAEELRSRFAGLRTAGIYYAPAEVRAGALPLFRELTPDEADDVVRTINASGASVVWVGLGTPRQERWMAAFVSRLDVPVLIGVGAAFDFLTGRVKRAPGWMQRSGLEWLYRLIQEPRRLWRRYLRSNLGFLALVACQKLGLRRFDG